MEEKKLAEKIRNSKNLLVTIEECLAHRDSKAKREAKKKGLSAYSYKKMSLYETRTIKLRNQYK